MKKFKKIDTHISNPILVNIIFLISICVSVLISWYITLSIGGYFDGNINLKINLLFYCSILLLSGTLFVRIENLKQLVWDILPIIAILYFLIILSCYTTLFDVHTKWYVIPYDFYRGILFTSRELSEANSEVWRQYFFEQLLFNLITPCAFILIPTVKYIARKKHRQD